MNTYTITCAGDSSWVVPEDDKASKAEFASTNLAAAADSSEFAPACEPPSVTLPMPTYGGNGGTRGRSSSTFSGLSSLVGEQILPRLIVILVSSFVVLLQSSIKAGDVSTNGGPVSYGIAVGCISFSSTAGLIVFAKLKPSIFANYVVPRVPGDLSVMQAFAVFIAIWWAPAALVLTFFEPFLVTSNAYFAIWAAFIASLLVLGDCFQRVGSAFSSMSTSRIHDDSNAKALIGLSLSSAIVMVASFEFAGMGQGKGTFGITVGILSTTAGALLYYLCDRKKIGAPAYLFLPLLTSSLLPVRPTEDWCTNPGRDLPPWRNAGGVRANGQAVPASSSVPRVLTACPAFCSSQG